MKLNKQFAVAGLVIGLFFVSTAGRAAVLFDNLSAVSDGADPTNPALGFAPLYNSFSTGGAAFTLRNIGLQLFAETPADGGTFTVTLLTDNATSPGLAVLTRTFNDSVLTNSLSPFFLTVSPTTLAANSRYWIGISSSGSVDWAFSFDTSGPGVSGEFFTNVTGTPSPSSEGLYQMQISSIPEPSTWVMLLLAFAGMGVFGYRRARLV
jgi:hypothetical protein